MLVLGLASCRKSEPSATSTKSGEVTPADSGSVASGPASGGPEAWKMPARKSCRDLPIPAPTGRDSGHTSYRTIQPVDLFEDSGSVGRYLCTLDTGVVLDQVEERPVASIRDFVDPKSTSTDALFEWLDRNLEPESFSTCGGPLLSACPTEVSSSSPFGYGKAGQLTANLLYRKFQGQWGYWQRAQFGDRSVAFFSTGIEPADSLRFRGFGLHSRLPAYGIAVKTSKIRSLEISEGGAPSYAFSWNGRSLLLGFDQEECVAVHAIERRGDSLFALKAVPKPTGDCALPEVTQASSLADFDKLPYDSLEYVWNLKASVLKVERRQHAKAGGWSAPNVRLFLRPEAFAGIRTLYVPFYVDDPNPAGPIVWNEGGAK